MVLTNFSQNSLSLSLQERILKLPCAGGRPAAKAICSKSIKKATLQAYPWPANKLPAFAPAQAESRD
jgi:hypothetical protein